MVESRGNGIRYTAQCVLHFRGGLYIHSFSHRGSNFVQGSLNWGISKQLNGVSKTYSWWTQRRKSFSSEFHTYALEWTEDFLCVSSSIFLSPEMTVYFSFFTSRRIYVDTRLHTLLDLKFDKPFFKRGEFPQVVYNGSTPVALQNPWTNGTNATPFDQGSFFVSLLPVKRSVSMGFLTDRSFRWVRILLDFERGGGRYEWVVPGRTGEQALVESCCQCVWFLKKNCVKVCADHGGGQIRCAILRRHWHNGTPLGL